VTSLESFSGSLMQVHCKGTAVWISGHAILRKN